MRILVLINGILLLVIALFHFYWLIGGKFGRDAVFPSLKGKAASRARRPVMTLIAALGFCLLAYFTLGADRVLGIYIPAQGLKYGLPLLAFIFAMRAVGDFKYVGFFKKERTGSFARNDTRIYAPLSLFMGVVFLLIFLKIAGI
jgi:hypothetical protein